MYKSSGLLNFEFSNFLQFFLLMGVPPIHRVFCRGNGRHVLSTVRARKRGKTEKICTSARGYRVAYREVLADTVVARPTRARRRAGRNKIEGKPIILQDPCRDLRRVHGYSRSIVLPTWVLETKVIRDWSR